MKKSWYNILPWIALTSGILVVLFSVTVIIFKPQKNFENKINREIAFNTLKQISIESKEMINNKSFFDSVNKIINFKVINTIWIVSDKGNIVYTKGLMAPSTPLNMSVNSLVDDQSRGLIDAIKESIDPIQRQLISVAAAIRHEGEHNDVFGHLVIPLISAKNEFTGFIGVAYELDNSKPSFKVYALGIALFICFLIYWFSIPIWVYFDSRSRSEKYFLWTIFVLIGNLPAYIAYLISRK